MRLLKYRDLYPRQNLPRMNWGVGGEFRCILRNSMGGMVYDSGWFPNLITNFGLTMMSTDFLYGCQIGSDATAPAFTDTALGSLLASSVAVPPSGDSWGDTPVSPNYERWNIVGWRFGAGLGTGTVRELGCYTTGQPSINIRTLVSPAIVKAADQVLDIYYKFTLWPDLTLSTGTTVIDGVTYNYSARYGDALYMGQISKDIDWNYSNSIQLASSSTTDTSDVTTGITGSTNGSTTSIVAAATTTTYRELEVYYGLDTANWAGGLRSCKGRYEFGINVANEPCYRINFSAVSDGSAIPKDATKTFTINYGMTWSRH